jgi:Host cell surface-exposed lipoprotein
MTLTDCIRLSTVPRDPGRPIVLVACGSSSVKTVTTTVAETTTEAAPPANTPPAGSEANLTTPQKNAVRAAQNYLSISGFSKLGLINQLSSSAGDGYSVKDATVAVNELQVNWKEQAARAAKAYLDVSPFSCSGLVQQLSSSAGDKFTTAEAR